LKIAKPFVLYEVDGTKTFDYEQLCKEVYLWYKKVMKVMTGYYIWFQHQLVIWMI
jgi:hypothetical protein